MTTVQIVGIAVAAAVVVLLVVALLVTRRRGERRQQPAGSPQSPQSPQSLAGSFLDEAPKDSLARLGKQIQPVEDVTLDPGTHRDVPMTPADAPALAEGSAADDLLAPPKDVAPAVPAASQPADIAAPSGAGPVTSSETPSVQPADAAADEAAAPPSAGEPPVPPSGAGRQTVPLSDIIVTTSNKMVDLRDPEVRRMLTDLVTFEIDQATQFRQQGQTIDAVLQLTEAEKISRALGMHDSAQHIHEMMKEMRAQT